MTFRELVSAAFKSGEFNKISEKTLAKRLGLFSASDKKALSALLKDLEREGFLISDCGLYSLFNENDYIKGKVRTFERGFAFLLPENGSPDLFIPPHAKNGACQGDTVLVKKTNEQSDESDECEVVKIIKRGTVRVSGVFCSRGGVVHVIPDDKTVCRRVLIARGKGGGAADGDQVVCKIIQYPIDGDLRGEVETVCGKANDVFAVEQSLLAAANVRTEFPSKVLAEAEKIPAKVSSQAAAGREDFRDLFTVTIDGDDAKDFDDAISVEQSADGGFVLYVHIADVSEYVEKGSAIDKEAYVRGTSIYLPDRVIPMLPENLCNGICSLVPNEDRLTLTVRLDCDIDGNVIDKSVYKSIIRSNMRLTYKKTQSALSGEEDALNEYAEAMPMLYRAKRLKDLFLKQREERGFVDLEVDECTVSFKDGEVLAYKREPIESERIIEQFMIAANVAVAEFAFYSELPLVYRVHEKPSVEKARAFVDFLAALGIKSLTTLPQYPRDFQEVLRTVSNSDAYSVINDVMLRSMQKAVYSSQNKGHFGLNEKCYCHFTSPIRRYPDLTIHRIIKAVLEGRAGEVVDEYMQVIEEIALTCSENERNADLISRDIDDIYICKFMQSFIGDLFEGIISGVTPSGVYVRLENSVEGFVAVEQLPRGKYDYFEKGHALVSGKRKFTLGARLLVKLAAVDMSKGKIYFDYKGRLDG